MTEDDSTSTSETSSPAGKHPLRRVFFFSWLLFALLAAGWSFATPISASPDEPAHIIKAASVVRGQFVGEASATGHVVQVPRYVATTHAATCFAFQPDVSPACAAPVPGDPAELVDATTTAGLYNPVYYLLVGWPSLIFPDASGIYAMRIVSGIVCSLFLSLTVVIASTLRAPRIPLIAIGIATPPMLFFLAGSVNPNALESAAILAAFAAMTAIVRQPADGMLFQRCVMLAGSAAVAVNARGLSPLWLAVAVLAPLLLLAPGGLRRLLTSRSVRWAIVATAIASAFAVAWTLGTSSLTAALDDAPSEQPYPGVSSSPISGFVHVVRNTIEFAFGMVGIFGWLDTPAPTATYFIWAVLTGCILLAAFVVLRRRELLFTAALTAGFVLLPAIVQGAYITGGGIIWQGRYSLPLFAMLIFGTAVMLADHFATIPRGQMRRLIAIVIGAWAFSQVLTFVIVLRRYVVGADGSWGEMLRAPEWSAPGGNLLVIALFTVAVLATAFAAWRHTTSLSQTFPATAPAASSVSRG